MITKTKTFSYKRLELCRNCRGERYVTISESAKHVEYAVCPVCMGTGRVLKTIEGTITVEPYGDSSGL